MTATLGLAQRLTALKHIQAGRSVSFVATATGLPPDAIREIGLSAGASVPKAIRELQAQIDQEILRETTTPTSTAAAAFDKRPNVTRAPAETQHKATTPAPAAPRPRPAVEFASLLAAASKSDRKRTQQLGVKIQAMLDDLAGRLDAESEARREEAARAAEQARVASERKRERERIEAEVKAAEEALRRSKAKLRKLNGNRGRKPKAAT